LFRRLILLALLLGLELVAITIWLDNAALLGGDGLVGLVGHWGAWILRGVVGFAALFLTFTWGRLQPLSGEIPALVNWPLLAAHFAGIGIFSSLSLRLYGNAPSDYIAVCWLLAGISAIALAAFSFVPPSIWWRVSRASGPILIWALLAVVLACIAGNSMRSLWPWASDLTFRLSRAMLTPFVSKIIADPATKTLGTPRFSVEIAPECSGLEGAGLMLAFGALWLVLFRRECRFPRALVLLPAGVFVLFLINSLRIALLILIGNAGAERIALGGFHSQAGWIGFNLVAIGFCVAAIRLPWIRIAGAVETPEFAENPVAPWVVPFVAILAIGMLARTFTADFEWLYPLRLFAALAAFLCFWHTYKSLNWRIGWAGPATGVLVFLIWIGFDRTAAAPEAMPAALDAASAPARMLWLALRVFAAVITVPLAEELAFRGFVYRRVVSADFESVSFRWFSWPALAISSLAFGLLHGDRWFAGVVAGLLYGGVMLRRGRIGEAVAAHGTTNALIAVDVLAFHRWHLW